jgi:hypothetical protein
MTAEEFVVTITLITCIPGVLGLDLGRDIGSLEFIRVFTQSLRVHSATVCLLGQDCSFQILSNSLFANHPTIPHRIV